MKKIFTSISMALCLAASSFNASAQQATQLSDAQKAEIALILANADKATVDGCDEELTLLDVCCSIVKCL